MLAMLSQQGSFEMMVLLFKSVKQFISEESLFAALESNQAKAVSQEEYEKVKKQVEAVEKLERLI